MYIYVRVDQRINGGQWNYLWTIQHKAGTSAYVELNDDADGYVIADAIKWEFANPPPSFDVVVDNPAFVCDWTCADHPAAYAGSVQVGGITNNTYSTNFGGGTATLSTIYDAFNPTTGVTPSSHSLSDIQGYVAGHYGFTSETNACIACHNQHTAQQNFPVTFTGTGGVQTAIRRVVHHETLPGSLWGDEDYATSGLYELTNEVFEALGLTYQAPYYKGGFNYEPANDTISDGSNLPNIISFCLDCHSHTNVPSTERGNNLTQIDWSNSGNWHGMAPKGATGMGYPIAPYTNSSRNYVLSCTDCHEPHGSENEWLLRTSVNGKDNISVTFAGDWWEFCTACHVLTNGTTMYHRQRPESYYPGCPVCHEHNEADPNNNF